MAEADVLPHFKKKSKKIVRKAIEQRLSIALHEYKSLLGKKKFESCIQQTAKLMEKSLSKELHKKKKAVSVPEK